MIIPSLHPFVGGPFPSGCASRELACLEEMVEKEVAEGLLSAGTFEKSIGAQMRSELLQRKREVLIELSQLVERKAPLSDIQDKMGAFQRSIKAITRDAHIRHCRFGEDQAEIKRDLKELRGRVRGLSPSGKPLPFTPPPPRLSEGPKEPLAPGMCRFPTKEEIKSHLKEDPLFQRSFPYLESQGVIEAVAKRFADREMGKTSLTLGVVGTVLSSPAREVIAISMSLDESLGSYCEPKP